MSAPKYSTGLHKKIEELQKSDKKDYIKAVDCGFCGYSVKPGARRNSRIKPDTLWAKYPTTCRTIFRKKLEGHEKTCSKCLALVNECVSQVSEEEYSDYLIKASYHEWLQVKGNSIQSVLTNEKIITEEVFVQPKTRKVELEEAFKVVRKYANEGSPTKDPINPKRVYTVIEGKDDISVVKLPEMFKKDTDGPGRPPFTPHLVQLASELMVESNVSAGKVGNAKTTIEKTLLGYKGQTFSVQTALRALVVKMTAADTIRANWVPKQKKIFLGQDGASAEGRHFIQSHLIGVNGQGNISIMFLTLFETYDGTSGEEIAMHIENIVNSIGILQRALGIQKIFTLLDINGLVFDTTSENTGKFSGVNAELEKRRKSLYDQIVKSCPREKFPNYVPLLLISCCDHVAQLVLVHFFKNLEATLKKWDATECLNGDTCILQDMFDSFGNLLAGEEGRHFKTKIREDIHEGLLKTKFQISFQRTDHTRYLSLPNLIEKFFEFEKQIIHHMEALLSANELKDAPKRYWLLWRTSPRIRVVAKLVVEAAREIMHPMMKVGNATHSWLEWKALLEKILTKAGDRKHARCLKFSEQIIGEFPSDFRMDKTHIQNFSKDLNKDLGSAVIFILEKWYGDIISSEGNEEKWIVATNRHGERFVGILKWCIDRSKHVRLVVICAYMMLRHCKFDFVHDIDKKLQYIYIKQGRELYNNAITRGEREAMQTDSRLKKLNIGIAKSSKMSRDDKILDFMKSCGFKVESRAGKGKKTLKTKKPTLTVKIMQDFLAKLKRRRLYDGDVNRKTREKQLETIEQVLMPQTARKFTSAFGNE